MFWVTVQSPLTLPFPVGIILSVKYIHKVTELRRAGCGLKGLVNLTVLLQCFHKVIEKRVIGGEEGSSEPPPPRFPLPPTRMTYIPMKFNGNQSSLLNRCGTAESITQNTQVQTSCRER